MATHKPPVQPSKTVAPGTTRTTQAIAHAPHALHYNKAALLADYQDTFSFFMKVLLIGVGGALAYFFIVIIYLGAHGHTKSEPFTKEFLDRYPYPYSGLKLPMFGGPAHPVERNATAPAAAPVTAKP